MSGQGACSLFACLFTQSIKHPDDVKVHDALAVDIAGGADGAAIDDFKKFFFVLFPVKLTL